jgi:hypothetical protein
MVLVAHPPHLLRASTCLLLLIAENYVVVIHCNATVFIRSCVKVNCFQSLNGE